MAPTSQVKERMNLKSIVLRIYPAVMRRINSWGLVLLLLILYGTAYFLRNADIFAIASYTALSQFHVFFGYMLMIVVILLGYDMLQTALGRAAGRSTDDQKGHTLLSRVRSTDRFMFIDILFFAFLCLNCVIGFLLYLTKVFSIHNSLLNEMMLSIIHEGVGLLFLSLILVKYYLAAIRFAGELKEYLREY